MVTAYPPEYMHLQTQHLQNHFWELSPAHRQCYLPGDEYAGWVQSLVTMRVEHKRLWGAAICNHWWALAGVWQFTCNDMVCRIENTDEHELWLMITHDLKQWQQDQCRQFGDSLHQSL